MTMKGKRFESIPDIEAATTAQLKTFTKEDFQNCFRKWQERWDKCVRSEGGILRGINGNVSSTVIILFHLNIYRIFLSHLVHMNHQYTQRNAVWHYMLWYFLWQYRWNWPEHSVGTWGSFSCFAWDLDWAFVFCPSTYRSLWWEVRNLSCCCGYNGRPSMNSDGT